MDTSQSELRSIWKLDRMISIDLKDVYLQVPMHQDNRRFLRFVADGKVYRFWVLCFGLSTAPQVFTRVMAPVSVMLHSLGIRIQISQRLTYSHLLRDRGHSGEGQGSAVMCSTWNYYQCGKVLSSTIPDSDLSGDGHRESLF